MNDKDEKVEGEGTGAPMPQLERMPVACILWDPDMRVVSWNADAEKIFGYTSEEAVGMHADALLPDGIRPELDHAIKRLLEGDETAHSVNENVTRDGRVITCEWHNTPLKDDAGRVISVLSITQRRLAEDELKESHDLLERVFSATHTMIAYMDSKFNFIRVNKAYASADNKEPDYFPGKNHFELFPDSENEAIFRRVVETKEPYVVYRKPFEYAYAPERGMTYWDWSLQPVCGSSGDVQGLVLSLVDQTGHVKARAEADELVERLRFLVEESPVGAFILQDGRLVYANPGAYSLFGYDKGEAPAVSELVHPDDREHISALFNRMTSGETDRARIELRCVRKDKENIYAELFVFVSTYGGRTAIIGNVIDITERRKAEEARRESERNYMALFGNRLNAVAHHRVVTDETGRPVDYVFLDVNETFEEFTGLKKRDIAGRRVTEVIPGIEKSGFDFIGTYGRIALEGEEARFETYQEQLGKWYSVYAYSPKKGYFNAIFTDITARTKAREDLENALAREKEMREAAEEGKRILDALMEHVPEGIAIADAPYVKIRMVSRYGIEMSGMSGDELKETPAEQQPLAWRMYRADGKTVYRSDELPLARATRGGEVVNNEEMVVKTKEGGDVFMLCNAGPIIDNEGVITGGIVTWRDITDLKALERQKADFYAMVTHDIKAPLTSILLSTSLIVSEKTEGLDADTAAMVNSVHNNAKALKRLIEDYLDVSMAESGRLTFNPYPVDPGNILREVAEEFGEMIRAKGLSFSLEVDRSLAKAVMDPGLVKRAVLNLLQNAVSYTPEAGTIRLAAKPVTVGTDEFCALSVSDNGPGIPENERGKVFDKYYRLSRTVKGTGLGLAIVKAVAQVHGGHVELKSEGGVGSTFTMFLPARQG